MFLGGNIIHFNINETRLKTVFSYVTVSIKKKFNATEVQIENSMSAWTAQSLTKVKNMK